MRLPAYRPSVNRPAGEKPVRGLLIGSLAALVAAFVPMVVADADTTGYVTAKATTASQQNIASGGTLTGLHDGDEVTLDFQTPGGGKQLTLVQIRQCRQGSDIKVADPDFRPTISGLCVAQSKGWTPASTGDNFVEVESDNFPELSHATATFKVSTGSSESGAGEEGNTTPIVCDPTHSCELWALIREPQNIPDGGTTALDQFVHWDLVFGEGSGSTTPTTGGGASSTSTTAGGGGGSTSTTKASSSSTSTTKASSSTSTTSTTTTSTTLPAGTTLTPSSVAAGGTVTVSSTGWQPSQPVTVTLTSDPVTLPSMTADAGGKIAGSITIPGNTAAGAHTLTFKGKNTTGADRTITAGITVTSSSGSSTTAAGGATTTTRPGGNLARTGQGSLKTAWTAFAIVVAGGLFVEAARRRRRFDRAGW